MDTIFNTEYFKELKNDDIELINNKIKIKCNNNKAGVYAVYSNTCPHCISLNPIFKNLRQLLLENNMANSIISGMNIKNTNNKTVTDHLHIEYVPKIFIIKPDGTLNHFNGDSHSEISLFDSIKSFYDENKELYMDVPIQKKKKITSNTKKKKSNTKRKKKKKSNTKQKKKKKSNTKQKKKKKKKKSKRMSKRN
jgi:hypothetical protein